MGANCWVGIGKTGEKQLKLRAKVESRTGVLLRQRARRARHLYGLDLGVNVGGNSF